MKISPGLAQVGAKGLETHSFSKMHTNRDKLWLNSTLGYSPAHQLCPSKSGFLLPVKRSRAGCCCFQLFGIKISLRI
jgi:hypothetical protein